MKDGFDSQIAQGGTNVSGGQKQRLSIARALVRKPEIFIFDDSFSALDFKTDAKLRAALRKETADSTVFIVAQRVSTVMDADRIIVLDDGKIAGIGNHQELIKDVRGIPGDCILTVFRGGDRMSNERKDCEGFSTRGPDGSWWPKTGVFGEGHRPFGMPVEKAKDFKGTLKRLIVYLKPHKWRLSTVLLTAILSTVFSIV